LRDAAPDAISANRVQGAGRMRCWREHAALVSRRPY
jgi:hypothetical protein